jgi:hypothetical protein
MSKNADRNAQIIALRQAGKFPWEIADQMGLSKNTVIGVCFRAGIAKPGNPDRLIAQKLRYQMKPRASRVRKVKAVRRQKPGAKRGRPAVLACIKAMVLETAKTEGVPSAAAQWGFSVVSVYRWKQEMAA